MAIVDVTREWGAKCGEKKLTGKGREVSMQLKKMHGVTPRRSSVQISKRHTYPMVQGLKSLG